MGVSSPAKIKDNIHGVVEWSKPRLVEVLISLTSCIGCIVQILPVKLSQSV